MWPDHPEKVCAFHRRVRDEDPKRDEGGAEGVHLASVHLDKLDNRCEAAEVVRGATYINCPPEIILQRLLGNYDYGDGRKEQDTHYMIFSDRDCQTIRSRLRQVVADPVPAVGMVKGTPSYDGIVKKVLRPDIYTEAMKEMGSPRRWPRSRSSRSGRRDVRRSQPGEIRDVVPDSTVWRPKVRIGD